MKKNVKYITYVMAVAGLIMLVLNQLLLGILLIAGGVFLGASTMDKTKKPTKQK